MGRIAVILDTFRGVRNKAKVTDIKGDPGGGALALSEQFNSAGDDSLPLQGDYALLVELPNGGYASAGNLDPNNAQTAKPGERRIYGRDSSGAQVCEIHLKNDGEISASNTGASVTIKPSGEVSTTNGAGFITLLPSGTVDINGFLITPAGAASSPVSVTAPALVAATSLTVNGIEMDGHTHPYSWTDPAGSSDTGGPQ